MASSEKHFTQQDQDAFARLSGDFNPIHCDPVLARRLMAGHPVVHGVHVLMWALDSWLGEHAAPVGFRRIKATFDALLRVGDAVVCDAGADGDRMIVECESDGKKTTRIEIDASAVDMPNGAGVPEEGFLPAPPRCLAPADAAELTGAAPLVFDRRVATEMFPNLVRLAPARQAAALLATTRIVGMECPGLHSIFLGLDLAFDAPPFPKSASALDWRVDRHDPRFGKLAITVSGAGIAGMLDAVFRPPPVAQPPIDELRALVIPGEFRGQRALVIGGARGLGETVAKLLALGGAEIVLTYHLGAEDARRVTEEIAAAGGTADRFAFDATADNGGDVAAAPITDLYYFASPRIEKGLRRQYSDALYRQYAAFYIDGFARAARRFGVGRAFYPSTVFVDERPADFREYAAAKADGETAAEALRSETPGFVVHAPRLPRLATDQTTGILAGKAGDPAPVLLAELRRFRDSGRQK